MPHSEMFLNLHKNSPLTLLASKTVEIAPEATVNGTLPSLQEGKNYLFQPTKVGNAPQNLNCTFLCIRLLELGEY